MLDVQQVLPRTSRGVTVTALAIDSDAAVADELITAFATAPAGDPDRPALRTRAIQAWLPLAHRLARRYAGHGEPLDDLDQVAVVGLIKAVDRFDADRGVDFGYFAIPTIVGELKRHFRDRAWAIRVPRRLQELRLEITAAKNTLSHTLGRSPTVADVAQHLGISEEEVLEGLEGTSAYTATSLSSPVGENGDSVLSDTIGGDDDGYALAELRIALGPAMACLDERERRIVTLRFYGNQTQTEIAGQVGISQMHVSRVLTKALAKMRTELADEPGAPPAAPRPPRRRRG
jgi:RNA polymerase sigma-B factor